MIQKCLIWIFLLLVNFMTFVLTYKTVVLVHGLNCGAETFINTKSKILEVHPGTNVILLKYYENLRTLDPLPEQLDLVVKELKQIMKENPDGIHLLCHSQGGLICLGAVVSLDNHTIDTFISLSGPLAGQYGIPAAIFDKVPILRPLLNFTRGLVGPIIYDETYQEAASIANYWRDPRSWMLQKYERYSYYLPDILNDPRGYRYNKQVGARRKENFLRLKKLVLVGGPGDEIITPWQSALLGFYGDDPFSKIMLDTRETEMYLGDWFGLKTKFSQGGVERYIIPGINHDGWPGSDLVLKTAVYPWLT